MAQLAACVLALFALAAVLRRHPVAVVAIAMALWFALPAVAAYRLTGVDGGTLGFHPSTWLLVGACCVQVLFEPRRMAATLSRHRYLSLVVATFTLGAAVTSRLLDSGGTRLLGDQIVAPFLAFWLVVTFATRPSQVRLLRNVLLVVVAAECVLALVQRGFGRLLLFESDFEKLYWFHPERFSRWMGTTDSPLLLSTAICAAAPLAVGLRRTSVRLVLLVLFVVGVVIVQSRTGAATIALVVLYVVLRARVSLLNRVVVSAAVVIGGVALFSTTLVAGLGDRIGNDTGSSEARGLAFRFFLEHARQWFFVGEGLTSSYRVTSEAGLVTSLESSYLMYAVDVGLVLATFYFGAQYAVVIGARRHRRSVLGVLPATVLVLTLQHTFSGLGSADLLGVLVWLLLAMLVCPGNEADGVPEPAVGRAVVAVSSPAGRQP